MDWEREITEHLNTAQIILLLVSPDFMASDYCYGVEMKKALERHERGEADIIPVILRPVYWQGAPFGSLQALPTDAKPVTGPSWHSLDKAFFNVAEGIRKVANSQKWREKGEAHFHAGHFKKALAAFEHALDLDPKNTSIYLLKFIALTWLDRPDEAYTDYGETLQFIYGSDAAFADLERRAIRSCVTFKDQPMPRGTVPKSARIGFEVNSLTGEALFLVDKGLTYTGSNTEVDEWITSGTKRFSNFAHLREWIRHELASAY